MAEVAGTIFGVISLSIQLFEKLNTYTNSVKDARTKAEQITSELDTLVNLLENLETIISRLDPTTSTALTRNSIQECARAIEVIRSRFGDVPPVKGSVRFWTRSENVIKRLTYPFKENDIKYWKDVLASIQQSLQTALLVSQIDQQQRYFMTVQAQIGQLSLNTSAGIQMIIDRQRYFQTQDSSYTTRQNQMCGISCLFDQRLHDSGQRLLDLGQQVRTVRGVVELELHWL
ncbi:hypothetical protein AA0111_g1172 [Alternaria arborescens]|uniref:hypothetical protein n=1 Tax=Alternaria arborescens TaxID=156630 RepID=UPI0010754E2C|nr:hypothetical protein AA0111_g1172 [Alternaria arborescens]RYO41136.1 hypothetical protein AA0111_g1172 [Alternaria arborescens]